MNHGPCRYPNHITRWTFGEGNTINHQAGARFK
jgi:hypothetical protein